MFILSCIDNNLIIDIVDSYSIFDGSIDIIKNSEEYIYINQERFIINEVQSIPEGVIPQKYFYINGEFILNENYNPPV